MQFRFGQENLGSYHILKFNDTIDDFIFKTISECSALYSIESLRLAFSRISKEDLLCIVTLNALGQLSVKTMQSDQNLLIESIVLPMTEDDDFD